MTDEQRARLEALRGVLPLFPRPDDPPDAADLIALAEWVSDGSISTATAIIGQRHALYAERIAKEDL